MHAKVWPTTIRSDWLLYISTSYSPADMHAALGVRKRRTSRYGRHTDFLLHGCFGCFQIQTLKMRSLERSNSRFSLVYEEDGHRAEAETSRTPTNPAHAGEPEKRGRVNADKRVADHT